MLDRININYYCWKFLKTLSRLPKKIPYPSAEIDQ